MGSEGATCAHTLSEKTRDIEKKAWDEERLGQVCTQAKNIGEMKSAIEKLCSLSGACTYEEVQKMKEMFRRIEALTR